MEQFATEPGTAAVDGSGAEVGNADINQISALLDTKFDRFKREIAEESSLQLNSAVKRARLNTTQFKREGCKHQFQHNEEVKDKLEEALINIDVGKIQKAKELLTEGTNIIDKRQKIIKIADNHGWDTVQAYISDDLASDSEDDKRLSKAVRSAEFKRRERDRKRGRSNNRGRGNFRSSNYTASHYSGAVIKPQFQGSTVRVNRSYQSCWACGQIGHLQYQCPQRPNGSWQGGKKV